MSVKVLGEAPAMAMGNLFQALAGFIDKPRTQEAAEDLFQDLFDLPKDPALKPPGGSDMVAAMPPVSFDWNDGNGNDGGQRDGGGTGHRGSSHDAGGESGLSTALSLFKAVGHGDLDI
jgi:hypothetical protein